MEVREALTEPGEQAGLGVHSARPQWALDSQGEEKEFSLRQNRAGRKWVGRSEGARITGGV